MNLIGITQYFSLVRVLLRSKLELILKICDFSFIASAVIMVDKKDGAFGFRKVYEEKKAFADTMAGCLKSLYRSSSKKRPRAEIYHKDCWEL